MLIEKTVTRENGIKAEDSAVIVQAVSQFKSDVYVIVGNRKVNAKSLIGLLSLNIRKNDKIIISIEGVDENAARDAIVGLL